jgi:hypothetical protein
VLTHRAWKCRTHFCQYPARLLQDSPLISQRGNPQIFPVGSRPLCQQVQVANLVYSRRPVLLWKLHQFHHPNRPTALQANQPGSHRDNQQDNPLPSRLGSQVPSRRRNQQDNPLPSRLGSQVPSRRRNRQPSQRFSRARPHQDNRALGLRHSLHGSHLYNQHFNQAHSHQFDPVEILLLSLLDSLLLNRHAGRLVNQPYNHPDNL